jgi:restriction system protein
LWWSLSVVVLLTTVDREERDAEIPLSMQAAAKKVLREAGRPLKPSEITQIAVKRKMIVTRGKTPEATMAARLAVAAKKGELFVRTAPNTYAIRS